MNRTILFYGLCIPMRTTLALSPLFVSPTHFPKLAILMSMIGIPLLILWAFQLRPYAPEASDGKPWQVGRLLHGIVYSIAALILLNQIPVGKKVAVGLLLIDVVISAIRRYIHVG